ncbi:TcdA/TcdB pore forming domain-containing protein [Camillea tinctor]|nr:TcdA/TcdB pore forming domain-containing protein [Camillea tinctor]
MADNADPAIHDFVRDPLAFLTPSSGEGRPRCTAISSQGIFQNAQAIPGGIPDQNYFKLVLQSNDVTRTLAIKYHGPDSQGDPNVIQAYYLGYNGGAQRTNTPAFLDIPKVVDENTLLFTGELSGCSVIVTDHDEDHYRVYHDSRLEASLHYDNVVMAIDYSGYGFSNESIGSVFMQYRNKQWTMFVQLQTHKSVNGTTIAVPRPKEMFAPQTTYFDPITLLPGSYDASHAREVFEASREANRDELNRLASEVLPGSEVPNEPDGTFQPFEGKEVSLSNSAVRHSEAIREFIDKAPDQFVPAEGEYPLLESVLKWRDFPFKGLAQAQAPTYGFSVGTRGAATNVVSASRSFDYIYLWIKQKEAKGFGAVVKTDSRREAPVGHTTGEIFTDQELDALSTSNQEFAGGFDTYESTTIPGFNKDMSPVELMKLFDNASGDLNQTHLGALLHYVKDAQEKAFRESIWDQTNNVVEMFQNEQGVTKPMPQDILLNAVPDEYGGRCYPLVRAMSVALADSDFAVDQLGVRLVALSPGNEADMLNAELFKQCLKDLHASYPAVEASTLIGRTSLRDAVSRLEVEEEKSIIFAMHTDTHAMLLGATNRGGSTSYHFYDPNFTLATFTSQEGLLNAATKFFTDLKFADVYGAESEQSDIFLTLVRLDTDKMARIGFDYNLSVADFVGPATLLEAVDVKATMGLYVPYTLELTEDPILSAGASLLEASGLAEVWREATAKLEASAGLEGHWMPILDTLEDISGGGYRVQFISLENTKETRWVSTEDPEIKNFRVYIEERLQASSKAYRYEAETFIQKEGVSSAEAIDGLNAMFAIKTLIEHFRARKDTSQSDRETNADLAMALEVQSYLNLTQLGQQTLGDAVKIVELTQTIINSGQVAESSLSTIVRSFGRVSEGIGFVFGAVNVGLDAYELHNAENATERAVYGTQLGFDSASFLAASGGVGAGLLGASSAAAVLGGVGVILGGLAIGFGALASAFGKVAEDAEVVGRYFGDTEAAYKAGGYKYDGDQKILVPLVGAVISEIDTNGDVTFDSQYIYSTHHGQTGSGYINYFFWIGDFPTMCKDKSKAINIRKGIRAPASGTLANNTEYTTMILPATPKSYISYEYMILPFATTRHDYGFDLIRELEVDGNFDYDFYIFPSEYIIRHISHEYVETPVTVNLGSRSVRVQVPHLPDNMHNVLKYSLYGAGADYTVGLDSGVGLTLASKSKDTRWVLDSRELGDHPITVEDDGVSMAGVRVGIADRNFASMLVLRANAEVLQVDFDKRSTFPVEEDASKFPGGTEGLFTYLNDLSDKHLLSSKSIIVENYTTSGGENVGRAFYEVGKKRMVYTRGAPEELTNTVQLGADMGADGVCLYNTEQSGIWRVDPTTGTCLAKYNALFPSDARTLMRVWEEDNLVHAVFRHQLSGNQSGELAYVLNADSMKLVSMVGTPDLLRKLDGLDKWNDPANQLLDDYNNSNDVDPPSLTDALPGDNITAGLSPHIISIFGKDYDGEPSRFWIRFPDRAIIKITSPPPPPDIVLAGIITLPVSNAEEFYFYSRKEQRIIAQTGTGTQTSKQTDISVPAQFGSLSNVFCANNEMYAVTSSGYLLRLTSQGTFLLEGVNGQWFAQFESGGSGPWWTALKSLAESYGATTVAIFDLRDARSAAVPAWLCNGRIVLASPPLSERLKIAGLTENGGKAWLCHHGEDESGQLYSQPIVADAQLAEVLSPTKPSVSSDKIPKCTQLLEEYPFKKVSRTNDGLRYTTIDGVVCMITDADAITLYGVDKAWQQDHLTSLEPDLAALVRSWAHSEVVVMIGANAATRPAWYLVPADRILTVTDPAITWLDGPVWLGLDVSGSGGYFYLATSGKIHALGVPDAVSAQDVTLAARLGDLLVVVARPGENYTSMALQNVRKVMVSQVKGGSSTRGYIVTPDSWESYNTHMVDWKSSGRVEIEPLERPGEEVGSFRAKKINDDLVIFDAYTCRALTIRRVFKGEVAATDVTVSFDGLAFRFRIGDRNEV